ncbi:hypothetical protein [Phenylobacterium montanum]|uniref:Uncharacterized protein n=1 Tax=Phenylobacterium montanum TaxID=2823693 RepID=A0A975G289_9CAUL|nr:hypothetical protein [Caulobacter sp. S6]QUD89545.1 hypothetical protein KCG34_06595 [Caulobacter sp. S6]
MADPVQKARHPIRTRGLLVDFEGRAPAEDLTQFFLEERARRSFGVTGFLVSGGGAGAVSCWFEIANLYASRAAAPAPRLLLVGSGLLLAAVVVGFVAALAGYKAFETAVSLSTEELRRPGNSADRWFATTTVARVVAAMLVAVGGVVAFAANAVLAWQ